MPLMDCQPQLYATEGDSGNVAAQLQWHVHAPEALSHAYWAAH